MKFINLALALGIATSLLLIPTTSRATTEQKPMAIGVAQELDTISTAPKVALPTQTAILKPPEVVILHTTKPASKPALESTLAQLILLRSTLSLELSSHKAKIETYLTTIFTALTSLSIVQTSPDFYTEVQALRYRLWNSDRRSQPQEENEEGGYIYVVGVDVQVLRELKGLLERLQVLDGSKEPERRDVGLSKRVLCAFRGIEMEMARMEEFLSDAQTSIDQLMGSLATEMAQQKTR